MKKKNIFIGTAIICIFVFFGYINLKETKDTNIAKPTEEISNQTTKKEESKPSKKKENTKKDVVKENKKEEKNVNQEIVKKSNEKQTQTKPSTNNKHTHNFKYVEPVTKKVIDVPYQSAWNEPVYELVVHYICNGCGIEHGSYEAAIEHMNEYMLNGDFSHSYSDNAYNEIVDYIYHEEVLEQSHIEIIKEGYYYCECGAKK